MNIKSTILILIFFVTTSALTCITPQRVGLFSFEALGNRDHLTSLFQRINDIGFKFNVSYIKDNISYKIINFMPRFYYNDKDQTETYKNDTTVTVSCSNLAVGYTFDYSIVNGKNQTNGNAFGKTITQSFTFQKTIEVIDSSLNWQTYYIQAIKVARIMTVEYSDPKFTYDDKSTFELMLNGYVGDIDLKRTMTDQLNRVYIPYLQDHLNTENVLNVNNLTYTYKNNNLTYLNLISSYSLKNESFQGLEYQLLFELQNYTKKCNQLPITFDMQYGGLQEYIGLEFMRSAVYYGLTKGWFDTKLGSNWDVEVFQFYLGDIANAMDYAKNFPANNPIRGQCKWNNSLYDVDMIYHSESEIYFSIPYTCSLTNNNVLIQRIHFTMSATVELLLTNSYINTKINFAGALSPKFESVGDYVVTDEKLGSYYIVQVLKSLSGRSTFGTGFPTTFRKFPVLKMSPEYVLLYDPSQM